MFPVPTSFFLTSGVGVHQERLTAFELALRDADIEQQNLVSVSSACRSPMCMARRCPDAEAIVDEARRIAKLIAHLPGLVQLEREGALKIEILPFLALRVYG
jgi:hypothetical protein